MAMRHKHPVTTIAFDEYRDRLDLEDEVSDRMDALHIPFKDRTDAMLLLVPLKMKGDAGQYHYQHSLRVALLASEIAEYIGQDRRIAFLAGLLHDVGKALVSIEVLGYDGCWGPEQQAEMKPHVMDGYRLLRDRFDLISEIIVFHHRHQKDRYPKKMPGAYWPEDVAITYSKTLVIADVYDALHRYNRSVPKKTPKEIRAVMTTIPVGGGGWITGQFPGLDWVGELYRNRVLK